MDPPSSLKDVRPALVGLAATALLLASCGTSADSSAFTYDGFRLVGEEEVGLNGVENANRPPQMFLLLANSDEGDARAERQMVARYVEQLRRDGWDITPSASRQEWWNAQGSHGTDFVRVGSFEAFGRLATIAEGHSRTSFHELAVEYPQPLIVVAVEPSE